MTISWHMPRVGYASNVRLRFAKCVIEKLVETFHIPRSPLTRHWQTDLNYAIRQVRRRSGPQFGEVTHEMVVDLREQLTTSSKARAFINEKGLAGALGETWDAILQAYRAVADGTAKRYSRKLHIFARREIAYVHLEKYYYEEAQAAFAEYLAVRLEGTSSLLSPRLQKVLGSLEAFFSAEPGAIRKSNSTFHNREAALQFLDDAGEALGHDLFLMKEYVKRSGANAGAYVSALERIQYIVTKYNHSLAPEAILKLPTLNALGMIDDYLLSQMRFGTIQSKCLAFNALVKEPRRLLSPRVIKEVLGSADAEFREVAMGIVVETLESSPGSLMPKDIHNVVRKLCYQLRPLSSGEQAFREVADVIMAVMVHEHEGALARVVISEGASTAERFAALRALGEINTTISFEQIRAMYSESGFAVVKESLVLWEAYLEAIVRSTLPLGPYVDVAAHHPVVIALLKFMYSKGTLNKKLAIINAVGRAFKGSEHQEVFTFLKEVVESSTTHLTRAEAILAMSNLRPIKNIVPVVAPFFDRKNLHMRAAAAIVLPEHPASREALMDSLKAARGSLPDELMLRALESLERRGLAEQVAFYEPLMGLVERGESVAVQIQALELLAKRQVPLASKRLLNLLGETSVADQAKIIRILMVNFSGPEHKAIITDTLHEVVSLYMRTDLQFDLFTLLHEYGGAVLVKERLRLFVNDAVLIQYFRKQLGSSNPKLREFAQTVLDELT